MEKILVAMDTRRTRLSAGIHALNLAHRINAKVAFLLVFTSPSDSSGKAAAQKKEAATVKKNVQTLIEEARSDGIAVDYYLAYGDYESELLNFVQENQVTLLVLESSGGQVESKETSRQFLDKLRHRINCRIEVVHEKPETPKRKE